MSENDYIAEYVKEKYPEILMTIDFAIWKTTKTLSESIKKIDFSEVNKQLQRFKKCAKENGLCKDTEE